MRRSLALVQFAFLILIAARPIYAHAVELGESEKAKALSKEHEELMQLWQRTLVNHDDIKAADQQTKAESDNFRAMVSRHPQSFTDVYMPPHPPEILVFTSVEKLIASYKGYMKCQRSIIESEQAYGLDPMASDLPEDAMDKLYFEREKLLPMFNERDRIRRTLVDLAGEDAVRQLDEENGFSKFRRIGDPVPSPGAS